MSRTCQENVRERSGKFQDMFRKCLVGNFLEISENLREIYGEIYGKCLCNVREKSRINPGNVREISWKCPGNAQEVSGESPGNVVEISGLFPASIQEIPKTFSGDSYVALYPI